MTATQDPISKPAGRRRFKLLRRLGSDERGSTAIEFVLLIFPFTLMMFAVIETGLSFAAQQIMSNAADDLSRSLRVGNILQADATDASVYNAICDEIEMMVATNCPELVIDLQTYTSYGAIPLAIPRLSNGDLNSAGFGVSPGGPGTINQIRVFYRWPIMADFMRKYLSELPGGKTLLYSTLTWKNEPYIVTGPAGP